VESRRGPVPGKTCPGMKEVTEWPEAVEAGTSKLLGTNVEKVVTETERILTDSEYYLSISRAHNPYGDGKASDRIIDVFTNLNGA